MKNQIASKFHSNHAVDWIFIRNNFDILFHLKKIALASLICARIRRIPIFEVYGLKNFL